VRWLPSLVRRGQGWSWQGIGWDGTITYPQEASLGIQHAEAAGSSAMRLRLEPCPHFTSLRDFLRYRPSSGGT